MESVLSGKMLAVLGLVLLVSGLNEGRTVSTCELKSRLEAAHFQVMPGNMSMEELITRLVCKASNSDFNTNFVKLVTDNHEDRIPDHGSDHAPPQFPPRVPPQGPQGPQVPPRAPSEGPQGPQGPQVPPRAPSEGPQGPQVPAQAPSQGPQVPAQEPKGPPVPHNKDKPNNASPKKPKRSISEGRDPQDPIIWHKYGLFQLSDKLACDSGIVPSLNVCQMNCTALIDDDITDDITCLQTLISSVKPKTREQLSDNPPPIRYRLEELMAKECHNAEPSQYFSNCV